MFKNSLPDEKNMLAGTIYGYSYREAKGVIEALLAKLNITATFEASDLSGYTPGKSLIIKSGKEDVGRAGFAENSDLFYYEFESAKLMDLAKKIGTYKEISKYPPQIEDLTLNFPEKTLIGEVMSSAKNIKFVSNIELKDIYENAYTFRIWYHNPEKTLTDADVEKLRNEVLSSIKSKFGGVLKS